MDDSVLFWTFLVGMCIALNGCCIFVVLVRQGQYKDPEKAKYIMYEHERHDDLRFSPQLVDV